MLVAQWRTMLDSYILRFVGSLAVLFVIVPLILRRAAWTANYGEGVLVGTGVAVVWYTIETSWMRREMVGARRQRERPEVVLRLAQIQVGFFDLVVENISDVPARNVVFSAFPDLPIASHMHTNNIGFFVHGIAYLAPRDVRRSFFLNYPGLGPAGQQQTIEFVYSFQDTQGRVFARRVPMNLGSYSNNYVFGPTGAG